MQKAGCWTLFCEFLSKNIHIIINLCNFAPLLCIVNYCQTKQL